MSRAALVPLAAAVLWAFAVSAEDAAAPADPAVPPPPAGEAPAPDPSLNPLAGLDKATLEGFREAPLFTPSRKRPAPPPAPVAEAPPPAPPPAEEPPPEPPSIKLSGVVQGPGGAVAFVRNDADGGRVEQLRLGDQVEGWLVSDIGGSSLKLTLDDREQEYRLFERKAAGAAAGPDDATSDEDDAGQSPGERSGGDEASGDDVEEGEASPSPRPQVSRPRTQDQHNRRPVTPEGSGQVDD